MKIPLMEYSEQLAIGIETLCTSSEKKNPNAFYQIRKSSSSVFANISEAQYPQSLPDMLSKFKIARKECIETESWLKLLFATNIIDEITFKNTEIFAEEYAECSLLPVLPLKIKLKAGRQNTITDSETKPLHNGVLPCKNSKTY